MAGFDITSILDFEPPKYICPDCRGLFNTIKLVREGPSGKAMWRQYCPICSSEFIRDPRDPWSQDLTPHQHLTSTGHTVQYGPDLFEHARALATLVRKAKGEEPWVDPWPTIRLFFEVLARSRHFVHFASWGITHLMIGALKLTSMRVPVYGFVSNVFDSARVELTDFPTEAPELHAHVIQSQEGAWDAPHQKLIIIDGLLAFKGSTNLTNQAMRKADQGLDINEVVTDFKEVEKLNNRYFAPVWKKLVNPNSAQILMGDAPPF